MPPAEERPQPPPRPVPPPVVRFDDDVALLGRLLSHRAANPVSVSVCIPCRDEEATIGAIVGSIRRSLMKEVELVDELLVIDDGSSDRTAAVAAEAGAVVVPIDEVHAVVGPGRGKGNALWASLLVSRGELVVWCDGDLTDFQPAWIVRLVAALVDDEGRALVKASYRRPEGGGRGGGRTTELVARPLLSLHHPGLAALDQPLAGEYAVRRSMVEVLPFVQGWGVEVGLLLDVVARHGAGAVAQVDLGVRHHRPRPLADLAVQAAEVAATILGRSPGEVLPPVPALVPASGEVVALNLAERPPPASVPRVGDDH